MDMDMDMDMDTDMDMDMDMDMESPRNYISLSQSIPHSYQWSTWSTYIYTLGLK